MTDQSNSNNGSAQMLDQAQQQMAQQAAAQRQNDMIIHVTLTLGEVNAVLRLLNDGPFNVVLPLINKITGQAQAQVTSSLQQAPAAQAVQPPPQMPAQLPRI